MAEQIAARLGISATVELDASGSLALEDDEQMHSAYQQVRAFLGQSALSGSGTLFVSTRRIAWKGDGPVGLSIKFPQVAMHAISRDVQEFPEPCIYLQMDEGSEMMGDADDEDEDDFCAEVRLVLPDPAQLEPLFKGLCDCAALNPDSDMEEEGQSELFFDEAEVLAGAGAEQRAAMLGHYDNLLQMPAPDTLDELLENDPSRFDDGEDEEEDDQQPAVENGHLPPAH